MFETYVTVMYCGDDWQLTGQIDADTHSELWNVSDIEFVRYARYTISCA